jgi:hypothetical protein
MGHRGGFPNPAKRARARGLLAAGDAEGAVRLLSGSCYGAGYDTDYFELLGRALLACGQFSNAGRFLFLSGARQTEYVAAISHFLARHSDTRNFRQLQSQLPERIRVLWKLSQFPAVVAAELRTEGWPEDTQIAIVAHQTKSRTKR